MLGTSGLFAYSPLDTIQEVHKYECDEIALMLTQANPGNWYWCEERVIL